MKVAYRRIHLSKANKTRLGQINSIIEEYHKKGYVLTLRQLYYQLVTRNIIPNQQKEYAKLGKLLGEGRMAGIVDWSAIEDRLRSLSKPATWDSPKEILLTAARGFRRDNMEGQDNRIEVWVEKDALSGVLSRVTNKYGVGLQVQRGYGSITALRDAWERVNESSTPFYLLYLGDHDASGLDMIRDIERRIFEFWWGENFDFEDQDCPKDFRECDEYEEFRQLFKIVPIALTAAQIAEHNPPPNPAKMADPRSKDYVDAHGNVSYEVDALRPEVLNEILTNAIISRIDEHKYLASVSLQRDQRFAAERAVDDMDFDALLGDRSINDEEE